MENQIQLSESYTENKHEYNHYAHSVGVMMLHLEWKPKYGYKMFGKEEQRNLMSACIRRAASLHEIKIIVLSVMPEHIHAEVKVPLSMAASMATQILKLTQDRNLYQQIRNNGIALSQRFDRAKIAKQTEAILTAIADDMPLPKVEW